MGGDSLFQESKTLQTRGANSPQEIDEHHYHVGGPPNAFNRPRPTLNLDKISMHNETNLLQSLQESLKASENRFG